MKKRLFSKRPKAATAHHTILKARTLESMRSVLPVTAIMLALCLTVAPVPSSVLLAFLGGAVLLVVGMGLFTLGAEQAMTPMGEYVGVHMTKLGKLAPALGSAFLVGFIITISEPDLQVLATQVPMIPNLTLILAVAAGVGAFLVVALMRILWAVRLRYLLLGFYALVFILAQFISPDFWAVAFDSGGVTTGPMTVPFIMSLGVGISAIRSDRKAAEDSFGLVALCSVGPILAVLVLGLVYQGAPTAATAVEAPSIQNSAQLTQLFLHSFPHYLQEVGLAMAPIVGYFLLLDLFSLRLKARRLLRLAIGFVYTYLGLALFLTGVNVGFMPAGYLLGQSVAGLSYRWILVPTGMLVGYFIVSAEPAVFVLNRQVEELTSGAIPQRAMGLSLSIGVCLSVGLAMVRVLTGVSVMPMLLAGYAAALALSFVVPDMFTAIAFDSGGVASGPMTATFLLPFAMGACQAVGGNVVTDAFGIVAMVAMTPLVTIQVLGVIYTVKLRRQRTRALPEPQPSQDDIIDV